MGAAPRAPCVRCVSDAVGGDGGILALWVREARLFKDGSGTGSNFSAQRASGEKLSGGGKSSGLMSFLKLGDRVGTSCGAFTVTRISTTFVPDTQGPPSAAQHAGTNGSSQFQVWVSLETTAGGEGVVFETGQFSLVSETGSRQPLRASGSSLDKGVLVPGSSIDGQVWFDPQPGSGGQRWLVFTPPDGNAVRVSLGELGQLTTPSPGSSSPAGSPMPSRGH